MLHTIPIFQPFDDIGIRTQRWIFLTSLTAISRYRIFGFRIMGLQPAKSPVHPIHCYVK